MKNSIQLFFIKSDWDYSRQEIREILIKSAAWFYGVPKATLDDSKICRTLKGKPYFEKIDMHFSISHSDNLWACLMAPSECGLDVQYIRPCNFEKIAGRFFSKEEKKYVEIQGIEGFFQIWTRREAYAKYTGEGFFGGIPSFVTTEMTLKKTVPIQGCKEKKVVLEEVALDEDIVCTVCIDEDSRQPVIIREDWSYEDYCSVR